MMKGIRVGRILGFEISINPTWFIILFLVVWSLASGAFPIYYPGWERAEYWAAAVVAALLLFASVLVHELAHSVVARRQGTPVAGITLFLLGGVAQIQREARSARQEAWMAGVGPLTSLLIGGVSYGIGLLFSDPEQVRAVLLYLGIVNVALAVFNLLPGFPLDGGRLLRAAIWWRRGDFLRATRRATRVGVVIGYGLMGVGLLVALLGNLLSGVWLGFVGWMLTQSAEASYAQTLTQQRLSRIPARRLVVPPKGWVPEGITLRQAAEHYFFALDTRCLPIGDPAQFEGLLCLSDASRINRSAWDSQEVREVMIPAERVVKVKPREPASEALQRMVENDVNQVAVVEGRRLLGFVDRGRIIRYLEISRDERETGPLDALEEAVGPTDRAPRESGRFTGLDKDEQKARDDQRRAA